jgi:hypothetical protein
MADRDPCAEELSKLKLALAIFSMLDVFEVRVRGGLKAGPRLEVPIQPDIGFAIRAVHVKILRPAAWWKLQDG